ncbi:hypothetical protein BC332_21264 [Capsicum chinense]|nr:hypothetical protein BC332_21264 [Capsicum chinense]
MDVFAMKKSCSYEASSISATSEDSHEIITNAKKMKEKVVEVEGCQLKPHVLYLLMFFFISKSIMITTRRRMLVVRILNSIFSIQFRLALVMSLPIRQHPSKSVPRILGLSLVTSARESSPLLKPYGGGHGFKPWKQPLAEIQGTMLAQQVSTDGFS